MWLQALSLASKAATHIYKNKQETKMLMSDAEKRHALAMANGEKEYQGKLLTSRDSDWKDEFILILLYQHFLMIHSMEKMKLFLNILGNFFWYQTIFVSHSSYGLKATDLIEIMIKNFHCNIIAQLPFWYQTIFCWSHSERLWT
jgi:hypothetical protein